MLRGADEGSLRDLLPELHAPALATDLGTATTQAVARLGLASLVSAVGFVVVLWLDPSWGGWADRIEQALRMGLPLGFALALTPFAELWVVQGRRRLSGGGVAYLAGALGIALAVFQVVYAVRLGQTHSPSHALDATWAAVDESRLGAGGLLLLFPLTHVAAWALRTGLHRQPGAGRWIWLGVYTGCAATSVLLTRLPAWMPLFLFAVLPIMFNLDYWGADRVLASLRGGDEPERTEPAPAPLPWLDRLIVGGTGFLPASLAWAVLAGLSGWATGSWTPPAWALGGWFLHVLVGANYANVLNHRRRFARAELVCRHRLADPLAKAKAQRRNDTSQLARALCGQGAVEQARELVPQALTATTTPGFTEQTRRYQLAQAFSAAGDAATCLAILDTVGAWKGPRMDAIQVSQRGVALDQLGRPAEAQALTEAWDARPLGSRGEAIKQNNLAAFELHKTQPDVARALAWARAAAATRWGKLPAVRGTLGAALVADGQPQAALPHLEAAAAALASGGPPQAVAWTQLALGDAYQALGRTADATAAYRVAAEVDVDCRPRQQAETRLDPPGA